LPGLGILLKAPSEESVVKSDTDIKRDVELELRWDPEIDATDIGVSVKNGVVTLTGFVKSYGDKWQAESDVKRITGVVGVANDIEVRLPTSGERPDPEIARDSVASIKNELPYASDGIRVVVKNGWVTLEGAVEWQFHRTRAEAAVRRVQGIKGVVNTIELKPKIEPSDLKRKIEEAFKRSAEVDANRITVEVKGSEVVLKGTVRAWAERDEAEKAAWRSPGVTKVDNQITVNPVL
jgi:osmotically-inducible protein OsmY